jgi:hypothetical protein
MISDQLLAEIEHGEGETLTRAARRVPRTRQDRPVTLSCLLRWVTAGVVGPGDQRVHLEAARLAGKWVTTPGAICRFVEAQTPVLTPPTPAGPRTPAQRRRASERAAEELRRAGI